MTFFCILIAIEIFCNQSKDDVENRSKLAIWKITPALVLPMLSFCAIVQLLAHDEQFQFSTALLNQIENWWKEIECHVKKTRESRTCIYVESGACRWHWRHIFALWSLKAASLTFFVQLHSNKRNENRKNYRLFSIFILLLSMSRRMLELSIVRMRIRFRACGLQMCALLVLVQCRCEIHLYLELHFILFYTFLLSVFIFKQQKHTDVWMNDKHTKSVKKRASEVVRCNEFISRIVEPSRRRKTSFVFVSMYTFAGRFFFLASNDNYVPNKI